MFENLMGAVIALFESALFILTQLINILGAAIIVPGVVVLVLAALVWKVAWKHTQNVVGTIIAIFAFFAVTYVLSAFLIFPWIFKGSDAAMLSCLENASNDQQKKLCTSMLTADADYVISAQSIVDKPTVGLSTIIVEEPEEPVMVRIFEADALNLLTKGWNSHPPDWPRNIPGQLVGPKNVPQGLIISFQCDNTIATLKNENWVVTVMGDVPGIGKKITTFQANGYFVRDTSGFNAKPQTSIIGTGNWEEACSECYVDKVVVQPTPAPQSVVVPTQPTTTKVPFPEVICGYWGWYNVGGQWKVVPTTGGQPDYEHASNKEAVQNDISLRCPGTVLPSTPTP